MKLKQKQRRRLLERALVHAGVCPCRNFIKPVQVKPGSPTLGGECTLCGKSIKVKLHGGSAAVIQFLRCVSPVGLFCEHRLVLEMSSGRKFFNLDGKVIEGAKTCCAHPDIVLQVVP